MQLGDVELAPGYYFMVNVPQRGNRAFQRFQIVIATVGQEPPCFTFSAGWRYNDTTKKWEELDGDQLRAVAEPLAHVRLTHKLDVVSGGIVTKHGVYFPVAKAFDRK